MIHILAQATQDDGDDLILIVGLFILGLVLLSGRKRR